MPEYERAPDRPSAVDVSRTRLSHAAGILLREVPFHITNFAYDAAIVAGRPGGDAVIAGMIEFAVRLTEFGYSAVTNEIETEHSLPVEIVPNPLLEPYRGRVDPGRKKRAYLVGLVGTGRLPNGQPFILGMAITEDQRAGEDFTPVGILEDGTVFTDPPTSPRV